MSRTTAPCELAPLAPCGSPPEECPACTAPKEKYIPYDDRAERWVKRAVAAHVMYPDEEGADLRAENSALSSHIRFALVGLLGDIEKE